MNVFVNLVHESDDNPFGEERRNRKSRTASMEIVEATEESANTSKRPGHSQNHTTKSEKTKTKELFQ
ncbi:unnamed protein product [Brassica oleracea]